MGSLKALPGLSLQAGLDGVDVRPNKVGSGATVTIESGGEGCIPTSKWGATNTPIPLFYPSYI